MPATAVTELGAAGGRGLVIDHLINIEGSFTSNGTPRLGTLRRSQAGAAMSVSVVVGPATSPMSLLQGDEDEHADPAPVTAEPQETRTSLAVSSAGIYSPTTATTTTWAGTGSPAATPTVNATASSNSSPDSATTSP